ncbi:MAG: M42 family metallopeptidase [Ruminococcaceae bacterium]|nr:M42 family metallopeptidase [Oscillospiraceae bacterium]
MIDFEMLRSLVSAHSPSGNEKQIASLIANYCAPYADEITTDAMGNLFVHKKGNGKKIMMSAHMDSLGLVVTYIDKDGYVRLYDLGGIRLVTLPGTRVRFENGAVGAVFLDGSAKASEAKITDMYIDIGASGKQEAEKIVSIGDTAVYDTPCDHIGSLIVSPYLDNRIGCYVLIRALMNLKGSENDCWFVFSTQEEIGIRGAKTAAYTVDPDMAIAVDVAGVYDTPGCETNADTAIGKGPIIKLMDRSVLCHNDVISVMKECAKELGISCQLDAQLAGGTDAGAIHITRGGVPTGILSIPTRYIHTPSEMVSEKDVDGCVKILTAMLERKYN